MVDLVYTRWRGEELNSSVMHAINFTLTLNNPRIEVGKCAISARVLYHSRNCFLKGGFFLTEVGSFLSFHLPQASILTKLRT
jgi:hypothetical protein